MKRNYHSTLLIIAIIFVVWAALFMYRTSFIGIDGKRYFNLFDDAMISMRYAWNLSHGVGLIWNPGQYVEGYTNLLMTLLMSLVMLILDDKRLTVPVIQLSGIVFMLGNAYVTMLIADRIGHNESEQHRRWLRVLTFAGVLFYYPLTYWSLMGMETGMVALFILLGTLTALNYVAQPGKQRLFLVSIYLGLAYLARPDALIAALLIFAYLFYEIYQSEGIRPRLISLLMAIGLYGLFIGGQLIFRWSYYGELVPNTYVLKVTGMPLLTRIKNGIGYIIPFVQTTIVALFFGGSGLILNRDRQKLLLIYIPVAYIYYQIWVGGDAWLYWRITAPSMPLVLAMCIHGIISLTEFIPTTEFFKRHISPALRPVQFLASGPVLRLNSKGWVVFLVTVMTLTAVNIGFLTELLLIKRPYEATANEYHANTAIALNELTTKEATIGVSSAGTVPYYSDRVAIDFLGKSDKYIARLPPDLSGAAHYGMMLSLPGHNKYDLNYSLKTLRPTYAQITGWGQQIFDDWAEEWYTEVKYKGVRLKLLKGSQAVLWDKIARLSDQSPENLRAEKGGSPDHNN